jgi:putative flippase GtrA
MRMLSNSFNRSQVAAFTATAVDYLVLFSLTELVHVWYVASVAVGAAVAAWINFLINRYWSFESASQKKMRRQVWRYIGVSAGSLLLNSAGVYAMTESTHVHYAVSVVVISVSVGWFFNYPLHRNYVFR